MKTILLLLAALVFPAASGAVGAQDGEERAVDVLVYGATPGGLAAAVAAVRAGSTALVLEPGGHVGGMMTSGLGRTDYDLQEEVIGGLAREFYRRVGRKYGEEFSWNFEPSVAAAAFADLLAEHRVEVLRHVGLRRLVREGASIRRLVGTDGRSYAGRVFVDATYEGDLMAAAGVSYAVGRESREKFGEENAGRREIVMDDSQFWRPVPARDDQGRLLPKVIPESELGPAGAGDGKFQCYTYRLCLTRDPANQLPIEKPPSYDPRNYEVARRYAHAQGKALRPWEFLGGTELRNRKYDVNNSFVWGLYGMNRGYPDGTPEERARIAREHREWIQGYIWFLQNDPGVPERLRAHARTYGLPKDEFKDTGGWPPQLYIREARRMMGEYVLSEKDLLDERHTRKHDSVGMSRYNIDLREVQWVALKVSDFPRQFDGVHQEGYSSIPVKLYDIPYRSLLPSYAQCTNLLVPVCPSASNVAFASLRMEPQFMILGQAAGVAAAMSAREGRGVHAVDVPKLQAALRAQGAFLSPEDLAKK